MVTNRNLGQERQLPSSATPDCEMEALQDAAETGNEGAFISVVNRMDWRDRSAEDFLKATQLALEAGAFAVARQLSARAAELYPGEPLIGRYCYALAPPRVIGKRPSRSRSIKANRDWLKTHGDEYRGQWIGLSNGVLLAAGESLEDIIRRIGKPKDVLITKVY